MNPRFIVRIAGTVCIVIALAACTASTPEDDAAPPRAAIESAPSDSSQPRRQTSDAAHRTRPAAEQEQRNHASLNQYDGMVGDAEFSQLARRVPPMSEAVYPDLSMPVNRENYAHYTDNPVRQVAEHPVSTFSVDVDTGSYSNVRRMLREGRLPPQDAVRVEELINYFSYDYPLPESTETPFRVTVEQAATPWNPDTRLLQIGIQGYRPDPSEIPAANLVFLIDVSGSMNAANKLPLLVNSMKMLTRELDGDDRVAIVVYAGASGVVLESTPGNEHARIHAALDRLSAGGSTNGASGIELAYAQARQGFIEGGINRVLLATDGDFNVGTVDFDSLVDMVERQRESRIALTTLGFGAGNYNDHLMEQLADAGDGNHAYIDSLNEARKLLVDQLQATLLTIARDVKIQLEFNPHVVAEYRLIGYENRVLQREDFNNDQVDAGDIGAGHTVTALYELALANGGGQRIDPLRYGDRDVDSASGASRDELGYLKLRYKQPEADTSTKIEQPIALESDDELSQRLAFAAAVAAFGQHLRGGRYLEGYTLNDIHALASRARGQDPFGYRGEFLQIIRLAESQQLAMP